MAYSKNVQFILRRKYKNHNSRSQDLYFNPHQREFSEGYKDGMELNNMGNGSIAEQKKLISKVKEHSKSGDINVYSKGVMAFYGDLKKYQRKEGLTIFGKKITKGNGK